MLYCGSYEFLKENIKKHIKKIKQKNPLSKITFIVYTNQLRNYIKETLLSELDIIANIEFYTSIDISKKISQIEPLNDFEKEIILKKILYEKGFELDALPKTLSLLIEHIKGFKIPLENIKLNWIKNIILEYEHFKQKHDFFDREDVHQIAINKDTNFYTDYLFIVGIKSVPTLHQKLFLKLRKLTKNQVFAFVPFLFDSGYYQNYDHFKEVREFYETITDSFAITEKRLKENTKISTYLFKYQYDIPSFKDINIKIVEANSKKKEIESIAKEIIYLFSKGANWRDICIVLPDFQTYMPYIKEIFSKYYVPYYLAEENRYIDIPEYQKLLAIFQIKTENFSKESLLKCLSKNLLNISDIHTLEKQIILLPNTYSFKELEQNITNKQFLEFINKLYNLPDKAPVKWYIDAFSKIFDRFLNDNVYKKFIKEVLNILKEKKLYNTLFKEINYKDFYLIVKTFFNQENKENKIKANTVYILKPTSAEGNNFKYIFFAGLNENLFPLTLKEELLVSPSQLNGFEYNYHILMQQLANFCSLFDGDKKIYLSYHTGDFHLKNILPSSFLEELKRVIYPDWFFNGKPKYFYQTPNYFSLQKEFVVKNIKTFKKVLEHLKDLNQKIEKLHNPSLEDFFIKVDINLPVSATDFQIYAVCPYRFYLEKVIGIKQLEIPDRTRISPIDKGILVHDILREFFSKLDLENPIIDEELLKKYYIEGIKDIKGIKHLISFVIPSKRPFEEKKAEDLFGRLIEFIKEDIKRLKLEKKQIAKDLLEKDFIDYRFKGRIDRVDIDEDGFYHIYDYKTGEYPPENINNQIKNKYIQLLIYRQFLERENKKVKQIGIIAINDKERKFYYIANNEIDIQNSLDKIFNSLIENRFYPIENQDCKYCIFEDICLKDRLKDA